MQQPFSLLVSFVEILQDILCLLLKFVNRKGNANVAYLWNVMDRESRFLIASKLSEKRDTNGAIQAINEAIQNSHGNLPQIVYINALRAYREGISQTLGNQIDHIAKCGITKPHTNKNRVERLNGTLRERVKLQRGWKTQICYW